MSKAAKTTGGFNPDKYLEQAEAEFSRKAFDPDEFLAESGAVGGRNPFQELSGVFGDAAPVLEFASDVLDYPVAPVRAAIGNVLDQVKPGFQSPLEPLAAAGRALVEGPSTAPTGSELAVKSGLPESVAPYAGLAIDIATGAGAGGIAHGLLKGSQKVASGLMKVAGKVVGADDAAVRSLGLTSKQRKNLLKEGRREYKGKTDAVDYGTKEIISSNPFKANSKKYLAKVQNRVEDVGFQIEKLYDKSLPKFVEFAEKTKGTPAFSKYIEDGFNYQETPRRIGELVAENVVRPKERTAIFKIIDDELTPLFDDLAGANPDLKKLRRLKTEWQNQLNYGKDLPDYSSREKAYNFLQKEANRAIKSELSAMDTLLGGSQNASLKKLNKEYGNLLELEEGLKSRVSSEMGQPFAPIDLVTKPLKSQKVESIMARLPLGLRAKGLPNAPKYLGISQIPTAAARNIPQMLQRPPEEHKYEGFPESSTYSIPPDQTPVFTKQINTSNMPNSEKAKRMQLLHKHGRVIIGD